MVQLPKPSQSSHSCSRPRFNPRLCTRGSQACIDATAGQSSQAGNAALPLQLSRAEHSSELLQGKLMKCRALQGALCRKHILREYSWSLQNSDCTGQSPICLNDGCCLQINHPISASFTMHSYQLAHLCTYPAELIFSCFQRICNLFSVPFIIRI